MLCRYIAGCGFAARMLVIRLMVFIRYAILNGAAQADSIGWLLTERLGRPGAPASPAAPNCSRVTGGSFRFD